MLDFDPSLARKLRTGTPRDVLARAFRLRAALIGAAQSCLCAWPVVKHETGSEHALGCPADAIIESAKRAEAAR